MIKVNEKVISEGHIYDPVYPDFRLKTGYPGPEIWPEKCHQDCAGRIYKHIKGLRHDALGLFMAGEVAEAVRKIRALGFMMELAKPGTRYFRYMEIQAEAMEKHHKWLSDEELIAREEMSRGR